MCVCMYVYIYIYIYIYVCVYTYNIIYILLRRLELLPGVTPLFREHGRLILSTLSHFLALLPFYISVEYFNCWSEENTGKHL